MTGGAAGEGAVRSLWRFHGYGRPHLRILGDQTYAQDEAVTASTRASNLSHIQYREGSISFLNVIDADREASHDF